MILKDPEYEKQIAYYLLVLLCIAIIAIVIGADLFTSKP
jgi:hypothetical protein